MTAVLFGVLFAELYVSQAGVGHFTTEFAQTFQPQNLFALVAVLAAIAVALNELCRWAESRFSRWHHDQARDARERWVTADCFGRPMSKRLALSFACGDYEITRPLIDGTVEPDGIDLRVLTGAGSRERHWRMARHNEYDVCEFNACSLLHGPRARRFAGMRFPFFFIAAFATASFS